MSDMNLYLDCSIYLETAHYNLFCAGPRFSKLLCQVLQCKYSYIYTVSFKRKRTQCRFPSLRYYPALNFLMSTLCFAEMCAIMCSTSEALAARGTVVG
jgi:hypothetical protein